MIKKIYKNLYTYRYDLFALIVLFIVTNLYFEVLYRPGQIVFSDLDMAYSSSEYYDQIIGIWNHRFNTTALLNIPRLLVLLPSYLLSQVFGQSGSIFLKSFVMQNIYVAGMSFYLFIKRLHKVYVNKEFDLARIAIFLIGSIYYALNPWVIFRIQHIFLLVGYSLFPLVLLLFFKIFDIKFQRIAIAGYSPYTSKIYKENVRDSIILALLITISAGAIHYFFYTAMILSILLLALFAKYFIIYQNHEHMFFRHYFLAFVKKVVLVGTFLVGFSGYWIGIYGISTLYGMQATQNNINVLDTFTSFSRNSDVLNVLLGVSYWWPMINMDALPSTFFVAGCSIIGVAALGMIIYIRKHQILQFFLALAVIMALLSTGVYYQRVAPLFLGFIKLPIIGDLFRDPNKFVGILVVCIGIGLVFGMEFILSRFRRKAHMQWIGVMVFSAMIIMYILPMKYLYTDRYYAPVEEPYDYKMLNQTLEEQGIDQALFLPIADEMVEPIQRVATPKWNVNTAYDSVKSTGDIHIYNSNIKTLFQYEGNDPSIGYYIRFLQYLMDEGRSSNISTLVEALGYDTLIYHNEYIGQEVRQQQNLETLFEDSDYDISYENDIFTVFETGHNPTSTKGISNQLIATTKGYERLELYNYLKGYHPLETPTIFMNQEGFLEAQLETATMLYDVNNRTDFVLSVLDSSYFVYPFEWTEEGNPYLKWSKAYLSSTDWQWYMKTNGILNKEFGFDGGHGVAVAFSPAALDLKPYEREAGEGTLIIDFDTMLRKEIFFKADNPNLFEVNGNPYGDYNNYQTIHGNIIKGEPKDIWQVAKSGLIEIKERTPYKYELVISGRFVNALHLKARFYNEEGEELGLSYIVAPEERSSYDTMRFYGEVIAPKDATHMRLELLSFQNPSTKSYWWIHDIEIYALYDHKIDNVIEGAYMASESGEYKVYVHTFTSTKGGEIDVYIDNKKFEVSTKREQENKMNWVEIGALYLNQGSHDIRLENIEGFNAVNQIAIVPTGKMLAVWQVQKERLEKGKILMSYESTIDMTYDQQIQTLRTNSADSLGKGIALSKGSVYLDIDNMKSSYYKFETKEDRPYNNKGDVNYWLTNEMGETVNITKQLDEPIYLETGNYTMEIKIDSEAINYAPIETLTYFDSSSVKITEEVEDEYTINCSECETVSEEMTHVTLDDGLLTIEYDATCSCDWYIYASNIIPAKVGDEYRVYYEAVSDKVENRHGKIIYINDKSEVVSTAFINEVEEKDKDHWNTYEQLIEVPENATAFYFQFWVKGNKKESGSLTVKNLKVERYKDYITLDHLMIREEGDFSKVSSVIEKKQTQSKIMYKVSGLETSKAGNILNTFISPSPQWHSQEVEQYYKLNGVTIGVWIPEIIPQSEKEIVLELPLMKVYYSGFILFGITIIGIIYYEIRLYRKG